MCALRSLKKQYQYIYLNTNSEANDVRLRRRRESEPGVDRAARGSRDPLHSEYGK
jgi:hypothetical protein